ncbi:MAG: hypothetical protein M3P27_10380 [Acidobacteriota bacterium]|nr:hypothetical protein [Acidobacteriota bacterium]
MAKGEHSATKGEHSSAKGKQGATKGKHRSLWRWTGGLVLLALIAIAVPTILRRYFPKSPAEATFVSSLRTICTANVSYEYRHPKQGYARTLIELRDANLIDATLASGSKGDYRFDYSGEPDDHGQVQQYHVIARSVVRGQRSAYMDDGCVIHTTKEDRAATATDPALQ